MLKISKVVCFVIPSFVPLYHDRPRRTPPPKNVVAEVADDLAFFKTFTAEQSAHQAQIQAIEASRALRILVSEGLATRKPSRGGGRFTFVDTPENKQRLIKLLRSP